MHLNWKRLHIYQLEVNLNKLIVGLRVQERSVELLRIKIIKSKIPSFLTLVVFMRMNEISKNVIISNRVSDSVSDADSNDIKILT